MLEETSVAAVAPGPRELTLWNTIEPLRNRGTIPLINSNLTVKRDGAESAVGAPFKVLTVNGVRVVLFSLMGGGELASARPPQGVEFGFNDPYQTAAELVPKLRQQGDIVVLMSQLSTADTDRLVQSVPGIDVALYGQRPLWVESAKRKGETVANETGTRGQYAGELVLIVDPDGKIVDFGSRNRELQKEVAESQDILKIVNDAEAKAKQMRDDARKARETEVQKKLTGERYLGDENCRSCHGEQHKQWAESPHARAFASLQHPVPGKPFTPACLGCHVTGYDTGGFAPDETRPDFRPVGSPDLANVQCEACHGVGTMHRRDGRVEIAESSCRTCHTPEWSPGFDYAKALEAVRHSVRG